MREYNPYAPMQTGPKAHALSPCSILYKLWLQALENQPTKLIYKTSALSKPLIFNYLPNFFIELGTDIEVSHGYKDD